MILAVSTLRISVIHRSAFRDIKIRKGCRQGEGRSTGLHLRLCLFCVRPGQNIHVPFPKN